MKVDINNLPKNVILADVPERDEEDESLKELYQELDLKNLILVSIDTRNSKFRIQQPKCKLNNN